MIFFDIIIVKKSNTGIVAGLVATNDHSDMSVVTWLKKQDEEHVAKGIDDFLTKMCDTDQATTVDVTRSDNQHAFFTPSAKKICTKFKVKVNERSAPDKSTTGNHKAERLIRTLEDSARASMIQFGAPERYFVEAFNNAVHQR